MWEEKDIYWMAGLFEGEGTISIITNKRNGNQYVRVALGMTDIDVIAKLYKVSGIGGFEIHKIRPNRTKRMYYWRINKREEVKLFLTAIEPCMGERRAARIREALAVISGQQQPRNCLWCGVEFVPRHKNTQIYCANKCAKTANRPYNKVKEENQCHVQKMDPVLIGT